MQPAKVEATRTTGVRGQSERDDRQGDEAKGGKEAAACQHDHALESKVRRANRDLPEC